MNSVDKASETQLRNIQAKTGMTLAELRAIIEQSGLNKHGEIRKMLMDQLGLGYGDANSLVHSARRPEDPTTGQVESSSGEEALDGIYTGGKASLRPIHDQLIQDINKFGEYEIAPKKGYVSLRRKKQFAMIGPASKGRIEVGLNHKGLEVTSRLIAMPPGGMCQYKIYLTTLDEVDSELIEWIRLAYENAG
jgi:hypothetical protein